MFIGSLLIASWRTIDRSVMFESILSSKACHAGFDTISGSGAPDSCSRRILLNVSLDMELLLLLNDSDEISKNFDISFSIGYAITEELSSREGTRPGGW